MCFMGLRKALVSQTGKLTVNNFSDLLSGAKVQRIKEICFLLCHKFENSTYVPLTLHIL